MSLDADSKVVIVGGGIGGLFAARYLMHLGFKDITIIEKEPTLGGLLKTSEYASPFSDDDVLRFDAGTHFILKTGIAELDKILDLDIDEKEYLKFTDSLAEGQYTNGKLYKESGCVNLTHYPDHLQTQIKQEMNALLGQEPQGQKNLGELLEAKYGKTAVSDVLDPIFKKFSGSSSHSLDTSIEYTFFPSRLILGEREEMKLLKQDAAWNERAAFASFKDSTSPIVKYYPKTQTAQLWLDAIVTSLEQGGVKLLTGSQISAIETTDTTIGTLTLADGQVIACDYLFWTIPPILLAHTMGIKIPSKKPSMRGVSIYHFVTDTKPVSGPFWVNVFDPTLQSYRVTLYDNFSNMPLSAGHRLSVEVLHGDDFDKDKTDTSAIFQELITMGLLDGHAKCLWAQSETIPNGFPIMQPGDLDLYLQQVDILSEKLKNLHIVSRFRGGYSGQMAIMENLFNSINQLTQHYFSPSAQG